MTSSEIEPIESTTLTDEELANVSAGKGKWYTWLETSLARTWAQRANRKEIDLEFEDWLKTWKSEDDLAARDAWIAAGRPNDVAYYSEAGNIWTE